MCLHTTALYISKLYIRKDTLLKMGFQTYNIYILLKSALKMQEMPFQRP